MVPLGDIKHNITQIKLKIFGISTFYLIVLLLLALIKIYLYNTIGYKLNELKIIRWTSETVGYKNNLVLILIRLRQIFMFHNGVTLGTKVGIRASPKIRLHTSYHAVQYK